MDIAFVTAPNKMEALHISILNFFEEGENSSINDSTGTHKLHYILDCKGLEYDDVDDKVDIDSSIGTLKEIIHRNNYLIIRHKNMHKDIIRLLEGENVDSDRVIFGRHEPNDSLNKWYLALPNLATDKEFTKKFLAEFDEKENENKLLNQKLTLLYKLLGDKDLEPSEEEIAKKALDNYKEEIGSNKIEGLRKLRDVLLKEVV